MKCLAFVREGCAIGGRLGPLRETSTTQSHGDLFALTIFSVHMGHVSSWKTSAKRSWLALVDLGISNCEPPDRALSCEYCRVPLFEFLQLQFDGQAPSSVCLREDSLPWQHHAEQSQNRQVFLLGKALHEWHDRPASRPGRKLGAPKVRFCVTSDRVRFRRAHHCVSAPQSRDRPQSPALPKSLAAIYTIVCTLASVCGLPLLRRGWRE